MNYGERMIRTQEVFDNFTKIVQNGWFLMSVILLCHTLLAYGMEKKWMTVSDQGFSITPPSGFLSRGEQTHLNDENPEIVLEKQEVNIKNSLKIR